MDRAYNIDEILAMAEEIERNGAEYYSRAAALTTDDRKRMKPRDVV